MASIIQTLMENPLPDLGHQKRLTYRTTKDEVIQYFHLLNNGIFEGKMYIPEFEIKKHCRNYWGYCFGYNHEPDKSNVTIILSDRWYCRQWLITTLAHEMVHQYQWDILGKERVARGLQPLLSHGPTFFNFRDKLKDHGISLKSAHSIQKWFKHQNLFKC
jgi:hypothetical protein